MEVVFWFAFVAFSSTVLKESAEEGDFSVFSAREAFWLIGAVGTDAGAELAAGVGEGAT